MPFITGCGVEGLRLDALRTRHRLLVIKCKLLEMRQEWRQRWHGARAWQLLKVLGVWLCAENVKRQPLERKTQTNKTCMVAFQ